MRTMQPCVTIGSYLWALDRMPYDEFLLRLEPLHAAMDANGWPAVLVFGDAREHAGLAYLTNFIPRVRWGMALLPRTGEARLLCAMSTRDLPAMRTLTWIADVQSGMGPEWARQFDPWFARFAGERAQKLGTVGFDIMAPALRQAVEKSLGPRFSLQRADDVVGLPSPRKRPRELTMLRASCKLLDAAIGTMVESWRANRAPETAALEAERMARARAAQDVRTLVSLDGGRTLVPFQGRFEKCEGPLVAYFAVKLAGYWADMFVTVDDGTAQPAAVKAQAALDAAIASLRPGVSRGEVHAKAVAALAPLKLHPALSGSVGHGIGLSLHEGREFAATEAAVLQDRDVYTLQVGIADGEAGHGLLSAMVCNTAQGPEILARSPPVAGRSPRLP
jgi:Xaa-Pro aminopeptidase